jgi:hypothetical protein
MRRVIYLLSHPPHAEQLVTSLWSLRNYWSGQIDVHGWEATGAWDVVDRVSQDKRLQVRGVKRTPPWNGRYDHLCDKIKSVMDYQDGTTLLLDCDTLIAGDILPLFDAAEESGCCMTQFCDWMTSNGIMQTRIKRLLDQPLVTYEKEWVEECLANAFPSPNVGVFAAHWKSKVLDHWYGMTCRCREVFIADECTMQALQLPYVANGEMEILDGRYNNSTMRFGKWAAPEDVVVWHGHGGSFVRKDKSPKGFEMWMSVRSLCHTENLGGIAEWHESTTHKHLKKSLA